jgi:hypothetical protein
LSGKNSLKTFHIHLKVDAERQQRKQLNGGADKNKIA